jgi:hypothetical protein
LHPRRIFIRIRPRLSRLTTAVACLLIAWFCAQQPQGFVVDVLAWLQGATRFSHQEQLVASLRVTLADMEHGAAKKMRLVSRDSKIPAGQPLVPAPVMMSGKIQLVLAEGITVTPPVAMRYWVESDARMMGSRTRDVPVPVPRMVDSAVL